MNNNNTMENNMKDIALSYLKYFNFHNRAPFDKGYFIVTEECRTELKELIDNIHLHFSCELGETLSSEWIMNTIHEAFEWATTERGYFRIRCDKSYKSLSRWFNALPLAKEYLIKVINEKLEDQRNFILMTNRTVDDDLAENVPLTSYWQLIHNAQLLAKNHIFIGVNNFLIDIAKQRGLYE